MKKYIIAGLVALLAIGASAQTVHYNGTDDTVPAFKVYNGYASAVTIAVLASGAGTNVVTISGVANNIDGSGNTDTVAELAAAIVACTNASGTASLVVDQSYSLSTDSTDGELLTGTYTAAASGWVSIPYDTSAAKFYQVAIPSRDPKYDASGNEILAGKIPAVAFNVSKVYGDFTGTGSATIKVYVDGAEKYSRAIAESYVLGAGNTNVLDSAISVDLDLDIPVGAQASLIVRASRATTASGGNIGIITE